MFRPQFVAARGAGARAAHIARRSVRPAADGLAASAPFIIRIDDHGSRAADARDACRCERDRFDAGAARGGRGRGGRRAQSQVCGPYAGLKGRLEGWQIFCGRRLDIRCFLHFSDFLVFSFHSIGCPLEDSIPCLVSFCLFLCLALFDSCPLARGSLL